MRAANKGKQRRECSPKKLPSSANRSRESPFRAASISSQKEALLILSAGTVHFAGLFGNARVVAKGTRRFRLASLGD